MKNRFPYFLLVALIIITDQASKIWVSRTFPLFSHRVVIPGFFNLIHIHNRGAIFGFLSRSPGLLTHYFLMGASIVAFFLVLYYFFKTSAQERFLQTSLSLILAGALGNLMDRVLRGYVIDFLDFHIKKWHWPSFNIADASVSAGAVILVFLLLFKRK